MNRRAIIACIVLLFIALVRQYANVSRSSRLNRLLTVQERAILQVNETFFDTHHRLSNPWRTTRRGCGGRVRRSARLGVRVSLRYGIWTSSGSLRDSGTADIILGRTHAHLTDALSGLCAGEVAKVDTGLFAVLRVGDQNTIADAYATADKLAREVVATAGKRRHLSCTAVCRRQGMQCSEDGFVAVNDCDRLRALFDCVACEVAPVGAAGADMPCFVSSTAPHPFRSRLCLVAPHPRSSRCVANHLHTVRLCPCVK